MVAALNSGVAREQRLDFRCRLAPWIELLGGSAVIDGVGGRHQVMQRQRRNLHSAVFEGRQVEVDDLIKVRPLRFGEPNESKRHRHPRFRFGRRRASVKIVAV
jgi:hypothetical protein